MCVFVVFQEDADDHSCEVDLEDILDLDTDSQRMQYAQVRTVTNFLTSPHHRYHFTNPLMQNLNAIYFRTFLFFDSHFCMSEE